MTPIDFAGLFRAIGLRGFIAIGLALALGVTMWRADTISGQRDDLIASLATEEARHAVTRQSVETLSTEMARLVAEGEARKARIDTAMERVRIDTAPLRREAARIEREGLGPDYVDQLREAGI